MTPPDRITYCDQCGWTGEVTERCPDCERDERIRAADVVEIWQHACELAEIVRNSLFVVPDTFKASLVLHNWEVTKEAIINPWKPHANKEHGSTCAESKSLTVASTGNSRRLARQARQPARSAPSHHKEPLTYSNMSSPTTSIIPKNDIRSLIGSDKFREQVAAALPAHLTPERFARVCLTALTRTPKLMECTRESLLRCLMDCSALGIEPDDRRAHLIPYGPQCTLIIGYKGLVELVRRSGEVAAIRAETVCENDEFTWENGVVTHRVDWRNPRGEVQAVYAEAKLTSGEVQTAVLTKDEVESIKERSSGYQYAKREKKSHPWITDWSEMAKKTAIRRLSKLLPLSVEIAEAMDKDDDRIPERNVTPVPRIAALPEMIAEPEAEPIAEGGAE